MGNRLILIGGGGHCHACIDVIESGKRFVIEGILDVHDKVGQTVLGYPIIGTDDNLIDLVEPATSFLICVGHIRSAAIRQSIYGKLIALGANLATIVSPHAVVSRHSYVGKGSIIMHLATVGPNAHIGNNCIVNTNATVEHDCQLGDHVHVSTHAILNGGCQINDGVFIGSNSTIFQGVSIAETTSIGAGSLVTKSLSDSGTYYGNPLTKKA